MRTTTIEIYTLSLHDALPIWDQNDDCGRVLHYHGGVVVDRAISHALTAIKRSEEHTSELQSLRHLVCRLLLEKKYVFLALSNQGSAPDRLIAASAPPARAVGQ